MRFFIVYYPTQVYGGDDIVINNWAPLWHFGTDYGESCPIGGHGFCCIKRSSENLDVLEDPIKTHFKVLAAVDGVTKTERAHLPMWVRKQNLRTVGEEFPAPINETGKHNNARYL